MDGEKIGVSKRRGQRRGKATYTWPIVISVETDEVGVEGESREDPWTVMTGRRAYRWGVDLLGVFSEEL